MNKRLALWACVSIGSITAAFAGWNGAGVPGGTAGTVINDTANWTGGTVDGDFSAITADGTTALVLTNSIAFIDGLPKTVSGVSFASNSTAIVFTSAVGLAVGQMVTNGTAIPYNTFLVALSDTNGTLSRATTGLPSGTYTFVRPALNFNFGYTNAARATNVTVTIGSDAPGSARTLSLSGHLCQSQYALPSNRVAFSSDIALACTNATYVTREGGIANAGGVAPAVTVDGPVSLGNYGAMTTAFYLDGGDLTLNGAVSGTNARINCCNSSLAGTLRFMNAGNTFNGGLTTLGGGTVIASASNVLASAGAASALGSGGQIGLNNTKYTLAGFSSRQVCDRPINMGGTTGSSIVNNGAAPLELAGTLRDDVSSFSAMLLGSYTNRGLPNIVSGYLYNGSTTLGLYVQGGVWRLTNPTNSFTGAVRVGAANGATVQFTSLANAGAASALGAGSVLTFESAGSGNTAYLELIGTNSVTCNRGISFTGNSSEGGSSALCVNGTGSFEHTGGLTNNLTANSGGLKTRTLQLCGTGTGTLSGKGSLADIINGGNTGRIAIVKTGSGAWTLSGATFNHQGATAARAGALVLDYTANDQITAATPGTVGLQGGTLVFTAKPTGTTSDALGTLQVGDSGSQFRCSRLVLAANGGDGLALTVDKLDGETSTQKLDLFDLSSHPSNSLTVSSLGNNMPAVNGVVMNNSSGSARASLILKTAAGVGFPALSGGTSGTLQLLSAMTAFPSSGYANTANYLLGAGTVTPSATVQFSTLTVDTSAGAANVNLGAYALNANGTGKGLLFKGANDVTFSGTGTAAHVASALWFHNYLSDGATFTFNGNLGGSSVITMWGGGGGFSAYGGTGFGNGIIIGKGVLRLTAAQTLTSTGRMSLSDEGILEIGADLNGAAAGDLSCNLGTANNTLSLYFNSGLSAAGATRTVNFGGNLTNLVWGSSGFLGFPESDTAMSDGGFAFKLSSPRSDATVEVQNPIDLNGNSPYGRIRTVDVANGSAAVDARLSGALSGNAALAKKGAGTLELTGSQAYDGPLMVYGGTLRFGAGNIVTNTLTVQLRGGGLAAGSGANSFGPLELYANATLDVGDGTAPLAFAKSSGAAWSGTLTITGKLLANTLRIGTDATGLTAAQLAATKNGTDKVGITAEGYLYRMPSGTLLQVR